MVLRPEILAPSAVAIIPARAGSKGVPGKNLALVAGKPLIAHTIETAQAARRISRIIVSTDSSAIAEIARSYGAEIPFLRPTELATDDAPGRAVWKHALNWLRETDGAWPEFTFYLQPTSPLRTPRDLDAAFALLAERNADWIVSVTRIKAPSIWWTTPDPDNRLPTYARADVATTQRQAIADVVQPNGALFLARTDVLMNSATLYTERTFAYDMPEERSLDIDTPWNLYLADLILKEQSHGRCA